MRLEEAVSICYPFLNEDQIDRLQTISDKKKGMDVLVQAKQYAQFWHDMTCRLLVPTPISHEEIIGIMERVTK